MSKKVIRFSLDSRSIDRAIREVQNYKKWLSDKTNELVKALAEEGVQIASIKFEQAVYDGTNDVSCNVEDRGEKKAAVLAVGGTVLFIEFGTGVTYPDNHPEAQQNGMIRGEYGKGKGANPKGWRYVGAPGTNGVLSPNARKKSVIHTYGNPANMCMYGTVRELQERFEEIARRVFND